MTVARAGAGSSRRSDGVVTLGRRRGVRGERAAERPRNRHRAGEGQRVGARTALPEGSVLGRGRGAPVAFGVSGGREELWQGLGRGPPEGRL